MALWRFLICFLSLLCGLVAGQTTKYGLLGQTAIFNTDIKTQPDDILWKHNENKAVQFNGNEQDSFGSFEGRVHLNWHSADLTINNLRYEDSGDYELETFTNNKRDRKFYKLEVIDKVVTPTISCKINNAKTADQSGDKATLTCSSPSRDPQSLLTFQWSSDANIHPGAELNISLRGEDDDQIYRCAVSNRLSQESATFSAKDCYSDKKSQAGLIAGVVVAVVVLLLLIALVGFCIVKRNNPKKTDVENHLPHDENEVLLEGEPAFFNNQAPGQLDPEQRGRKMHLRENDEFQALMNERRKNSEQNVHQVKSSDNEKRKALLHRDSTMPSKQTLSHLRQSGDEPYPNHEEKSKNEHSEISVSSPAPEKPPRTWSERHAKENGKPSEDEPKDAVEDEPSGSDRREENAESSVGHDDKKQEPAENLNNKEDDPADSEETNETSTNSPDEHSPEKPINRFQRAPSGPRVAPKPKILPKLPTEQKLGDENMLATANKEQSLENDPPGSGIETEEHAAASDNQNDKKQEPAENLNNKGDDPADSEETNETSTNEPNEHSPEKPINRFQRPPSGPPVAPKPKIQPKLPTEQKLGDENMPANVNKEQSLENDPADSGIETEESAAASDNQNDKKQEPAENLNNKEDDPADSEETNETSTNSPDEYSPEKPINRFQRAPSGPRVAPKPKILPKLPTEQKLGDENMLANVNKEQSLENDPASSGIETEESAAASDNQNDKKEEPAENLNNKEDDPADSEETNETSPNEPNEHSLDSSTNEGNDPPDSEITTEESAAATSDNQNDKKEEPAENLNNKEDDPADSKETNETSPNEPNDHSLESSSNKDNDPPDSEIAPEESAAETSDNQDSQNKKVENESAKATSDDDVQPPPAANSPLSQKSP